MLFSTMPEVLKAQNVDKKRGLGKCKGNSCGNLLSLTERADTERMQDVVQGDNQSLANRLES